MDFLCDLEHNVETLCSTLLTAYNIKKYFLQFAVSQASLLLKKISPEEVNIRTCIVSTPCTRSYTATTKQKQ